MKKRAYILPFIIIYNLQATSLDNNLPGYSFSDIAIDTNNNVHFVWRDGITYTAIGTYTGILALYHWIKYADSLWSTTVPVINTDYFGTFPALVKGQSGEIHLVYSTEAKLEHALWHGSSWSAASVILNEGNQYYYKDIVTGIG